jgi:hypothetical protein
MVLIINDKAMRVISRGINGELEKFGSLMTCSGSMGKGHLQED